MDVVVAALDLKDVSEEEEEEPMNPSNINSDIGPIFVDGNKMYLGCSRNDETGTIENVFFLSTFH